MDTYVEYLVTRKRSWLDNLTRFVAVFMTIFSFLLFSLTMNIIMFLIGLAFAIFGYFVFRNTSLEYEYLYLEKELSIDRITGRSKRKHVATLQLESAKILAPWGSRRLESYGKESVKQYDFTAKNRKTSDHVYVMYYGERQRILLEMNEEMVKAIYDIIPNRVYFD
ncbi:MAG: hypothetical protein ACI4C1_08865 [Lachnospiraceae bacterium]